MKSEKDQLIDQVNPALCINNRLRRLNRIINRLYNKHLTGVDISLGQLSILFFVGKMKSVRQSEIGKRLELERSTVTRELNGLLQKKYIQKGTEAGSTLIKLTASGGQFLEDVIPVWQRAQDEATRKLGRDGNNALNLLLNVLK